VQNLVKTCLIMYISRKCRLIALIIWHEVFLARLFVDNLQVFIMKRIVSGFGSITAVLLLSACSGVSGTTYGTGKSHEMATMESMANLFALKTEASKIEYQERPELIMPANKQALPSPVDTASSSSDPEWPESPEQRIAAVRAAAPEVGHKSGDLPVEFLTDTNKPGLAKSQRKSQSFEERQAAFAREKGDLLYHVRNDANGVGESAEAKRRREEIAFSTGVKRKYLIEPPTEYRQPSATAEAGDLGIDSDEIKAAQKKAKQDRYNKERGIIPVR